MSVFKQKDADNDVDKLIISCQRDPKKFIQFLMNISDKQLKQVNVRPRSHDLELGTDKCHQNTSNNLSETKIDKIEKIIREHPEKSDQIIRHIICNILSYFRLAQLIHFLAKQ